MGSFNAMEYNYHSRDKLQPQLVQSSRIPRELVIVAAAFKQFCFHVGRGREKHCQAIELWPGLNQTVPNQFKFGSEILHRYLYNR